MAFAVLLAAGSSTRFGRDKLQIVLPDGRPLWRASFDKLLEHPQVSGVGIVCPSGAETTFIFPGAAFVVAGGNTRSESSKIGVENTPKEDIVLVHDAARPRPSTELITRIIDATEQHSAAIPVIPVSDTIKRGPDWSRETLDRKDLFRAQTPQGAKRGLLLPALEKSPASTDEAMALENAGHKVKLVPGDESNIKITTEADLDQILRFQSVTGFGYDIHRFGPTGRPLILGGVEFPGERPLEGHSDADVVLHALTDALLGSCGLGDIGDHFPNTDPKWKNADSRVFLRHAVELLKSEGARVASVDITVLAEAPKLSIKKEEIRVAIAQELGIAARNVSIKATTAEGLGAIGRGEGIAAMAVATVLRQVCLI